MVLIELICHHALLHLRIFDCTYIEKCEHLQLISADGVSRSRGSNLSHSRQIPELTGLSWRSER
jgi:hypothetical protein